MYTTTLSHEYYSCPGIIRPPLGGQKVVLYLLIKGYSNNDHIGCIVMESVPACDIVHKYIHLCTTVSCGSGEDRSFCIKQGGL